MKLGLPSALLLALATSSFDVSEARSVAKIQNRAMKQLVAKSRRLEDEEEEEEDEMAFLMDYELKFVKCVTGQKSQGENGEYEYSSIIYRLCPSDGGCSSDEDEPFGCSEGYGDYICGINTFVDAWAETQEDNRRRLDDFNIREASECREAEFEEQDEDGRRMRRKLEDNENGGYYIGPACTDDGTGIRLAMFTDYTCTTESEDVTYEDMSGGYSLPYYSGGLAQASCVSCYQKNDDGDYEANEFCENLWEWSGKCEAEMESYYYGGKDENQCETIEELTADLIKTRAAGGGGKAFWIIFIVLVVGAAGFFLMNKKKKEATSTESNYGQMA